MKNLSKALLPGLLVIALAILPVTAQTIVSDPLAPAGAFDITDINGTTPSIDLPGTNWADMQNPSNTGVLWGSGYFGVPFYGPKNGGATGLNISTAGAYSKPASMTISVDLSLFGTQSNTFAAVGFYSAADPTGGLATTNFTGLVLDSTGDLTLWNNGTSSGTSIAFIGTFTTGANAYRTLSYNINTATGNISAVSLSGSTSDYSIFSTTAFTDANTLFAGIGQGSSAGQDDGVGFQNFVLSSASPPPAVPEPSTWAILGAGLLLIGILGFHRRLHPSI